MYEECPSSDLRIKKRRVLFFWVGLTSEVRVASWIGRVFPYISVCITVDEFLPLSMYSSGMMHYGT